MPIPDRKNDWRDALKHIGCAEWQLERVGGVTSDELLIRAHWPKKANGTGYDYTVWVRVYRDGSFGVMLDAQKPVDLAELKAMAAASYAICKR